MAIPTIVSAVFTMVLFSGKASATETIKSLNESNITNQNSCDRPQPSAFKSSLINLSKKGILIASSDPQSENVFTDFSEAESDAAVTLFGCDCSSCMRGLSQLRAQPVIDLNKANGHCWSSLKERFTPEQIKTVLQKLDAEKGN